MTNASDASRELLSYRFKKIEAELLRPVPKDRGSIEVATKTSLGADGEVKEGKQRALTSVEVVVTGLPAPDSENADPIFRIGVVVHGVYEIGEGVSIETLRSDEYGEECIAPLYALAISEIDSLAARLVLPRFRVPLVPLRKSTSAGAVAGTKPARKMRSRAVPKKS